MILYKFVAFCIVILKGLCYNRSNCVIVEKIDMSDRFKCSG